MIRLVAVLLLVMTAFSAPVDAAARRPSVVVTIKPLHSLVAAVMQGVGDPALLLPPAASPHDYALKPSDAKLLSDADIVFMVGGGLEAFLDKAMASLGGTAQMVAMAGLPTATRLPARAGGVWEADEDHPGAALDGHLWLDLDNAKRFVNAAGEELARLDRANAETYRKNVRITLAKLMALDGELRRKIEGKTARFLVFHDAYQYIEKRYGLNAVGAVAVEAERQPGAKRIGEIRRRIGEAGVACIFHEPQFNPRLIATVIEDTPARAVALDPFGIDLKEGPDLYPAMMRRLVADMADCLGR